MKRIVMFSLCIVFLSCPLVAETMQFEQNWGPQGITVIEQSVEGFTLNFSMNELFLNTKMIQGEPMTQISMPGALLGNDEHAPDLPGIGRMFAVPQGAMYSFEITAMRTKTLHGLEIAPAMVIPLDTDDTMPVYEKDPVIYATDALYPEAPVRVSEPRMIRGMDAGIIGITPFQYNPVSKDLIVCSDLKVKVTFHGGNGHFGEDRLRSRFFDPIYRNHMLNWEMIQDVDYNELRSKARAGEAEFAIIIPETVFSGPGPSFRNAAKALKEFRMRQGIVTEIYTLTDTGTTTTQIKNWIDNAVENWQLPPVGVLLLADAPGEMQYTIPVPMWSSTPSDNIYADVYGNDSLPDIIISRVCAKTPNDVEEMVSKVLEYETNPPMDPDFYECPTIAAGWQSDRWFVICADIVHGYFEYGLGKTPHREYSGTSSAPSYWSTNQNTPMLVAYFGPLGHQYIPALPSHLTDWGGNATRINADLNAGSFFAMHRDHGSSSGWSDPSYTTSNLPSLTNDPLLPFVLSINCSSGDFDGSSPCFAEAMYRMHHGAVGLIAASNTSYSFVNDAYVFGMMDSMFPDFDKYGGPVGSPVSGELMPGVANVSGKYYLELSDWPYNPQDKEITYHLFHMHGTPFFTMYSEVPQALTVTHVSTLDYGATTLQVTADEDAEITVTVKEDGDVIKILGTAVGTGGPLDVTLNEAQTEARQLTVVVTKPNHLRYAGHVNIPEAGTLTQYGSGLAGTGGHVPDLNGAGIPIYGGEFSIDLTQGLGGAGALMYVGVTSSSYPVLGGTLLVYPITLTIPLALGGSGAGDGGFSIPVSLYLTDTTLYTQVFIADPEAPKGVAMTNGLEVHFP